MPVSASAKIVSTLAMPFAHVERGAVWLAMQVRVELHQKSSGRIMRSPN